MARKSSRWKKKSAKKKAGTKPGAAPLPPPKPAPSSHQRQQQAAAQRAKSAVKARGIAGKISQGAQGMANFVNVIEKYRSKPPGYGQPAPAPPAPQPRRLAKVQSVRRKKARRKVAVGRRRV